ncbi:MAG TPA: succinate dehydrogenase cytochrome b subunit [Candidatus Binatia bacterium]|nr:succinate dehydrogenase cytochrome b subunit [Candidatus Binatia bacterium]
MGASRTFLGSTIGKKIVMAGSGTILAGFVLAHMLGNLQLYLGAEALNAYSVWLREVLHGAGLWIVRVVLLAALALHVWAAASLTVADRAARPVGYREFEPRESTYASRTMRWSGVLLFVFVVYHLLDLTFGTVNPSFQSGNVFHNVVASFRVVPVALFYVVAMLLLWLHLRHGMWSMLRTLGLGHPRYEHLAHRFAALFATLVVAGNVSFPLAVLFGFVR